MDKIIEEAYAQVEAGFPARLVADRLGIDYRELFKLERKRRKHVNDNFDNLLSWLMEKETYEFKTKFKNAINKVDYKTLSVIPQYWFMCIYIFLKNKEDKKNTVYGLLEDFSISPPTWRKYRKEILKIKVV